MNRLRIPLLFFFSFILLVSLKVVTCSIIEWRRAENAYKNGEMEKAILHYERCIKWYFPINPLPKWSAIKLEEIGRSAEERGDSDLALLSYQAIRSGFLAVRNIYSPGKEFVERSTDRIAEILAMKGGRWLAGEEGIEERKAKIIKRYAVKEPSRFWSVIMLLGLIGWISGICGILISSDILEKRFRIDFKWLLVTLFSFSLWIIGLFKA